MVETVNTGDASDSSASDEDEVGSDASLGKNPPPGARYAAGDGAVGS